MYTLGLGHKTRLQALLDLRADQSAIHSDMKNLYQVGANYWFVWLVTHVLLGFGLFMASQVYFASMDYWVEPTLKGANTPFGEQIFAIVLLLVIGLGTVIWIVFYMIRYVTRIDLDDDVLHVRVMFPIAGTWQWRVPTQDLSMFLFRDDMAGTRYSLAYGSLALRKWPNHFVLDLDYLHLDKETLNKLIAEARNSLQQ